MPLKSSYLDTTKGILFRNDIYKMQKLFGIEFTTNR